MSIKKKMVIKQGGIIMLKGTLLIYSLFMATAGTYSKAMPVNPTGQVTSGFVMTSDKKKIAYDHYEADHGKVIILAHGFYNSKQAVLFREMARSLIDEYDVIVMDFRGHGKSEGFFDWTAREYRDLEAVLEYAQPKYEKIGVVGFSLGAASSLITASRSEAIDSLIAVSPPARFSQIDGHFWEMGVQENIFYNLFEDGRIGKGVRPGFLWFEKIHPIDIVDQISNPVLFVHGTKDWLIKPWHSEQLFEKSAGHNELMLIEDGTHAEYLFRNDREGTIKIFKDWFKKTL